MNDTLILALAGLAGGALGAIFFGGLWWTVRRGTTSTQPALWFFGSLLLRTGVALGGFLPDRAGALGAAADVSARVRDGACHRDVGESPGCCTPRRRTAAGQPCALVPTRSSSGSTGF